MNNHDTKDGDHSWTILSMVDLPSTSVGWLSMPFTTCIVNCLTVRVLRVHGYHNFKDTSIFWTAQACFLSIILCDIGAKLTTLGIHRLKADPTVQEMSPRTVPVRHQRNPHSMLTPLTFGIRVACAFPSQFTVLYYPC